METPAGGPADDGQGIERFDLLLREKLAELDQAELPPSALDVEIDRLRLDAAQLVAATNGRPFLLGNQSAYAHKHDSSAPSGEHIDIVFPAPRR